MKKTKDFRKGVSWQAQLFNTMTRNTMKPLMRGSSIKTLRKFTQLVDKRFEQDHGEVVLKSVQGEKFEGEWVSPDDTQRKGIILYLPGGGFVMRTPATHRSFLVKLCKAAKMKGLMVHYRLAPEYPFPAGLDDCIVAYRKLLKLGYKSENITIAGDSAGGNLVMAMLHYLKDLSVPLPSAGVLLSPLLDLTHSGKSRKTNAWRDPLLPNHRASDMHHLYHYGTVKNHPYVSPIFGDFEGLPPILAQVGSTEILLDDSVRAAERAKKAGTPFYLEIWEGMPHVWHINDYLPEAQEAINTIVEFIHNKHISPRPFIPKYLDKIFNAIYKRIPAHERGVSIKHSGL